MKSDGPIPFQEIKTRAVAVLPTLLQRWLPGRHRQLGARSVACRREGGYQLGMIPPTKP